MDNPTWPRGSAHLVANLLFMHHSSPCIRMAQEGSDNGCGQPASHHLVLHTLVAPEGEEMRRAAACVQGFIAHDFGSEPCIATQQEPVTTLENVRGQSRNGATGLRRCELFGCQERSGRIGARPGFVEERHLLRRFLREMGPGMAEFWLK